MLYFTWTGLFVFKIRNEKRTSDITESLIFYQKMCTVCKHYIVQLLWCIIFIILFPNYKCVKTGIQFIIYTSYLLSPQVHSAGEEDFGTTTSPLSRKRRYKGIFIFYLCGWHCLHEHRSLAVVTTAVWYTWQSHFTEHDIIITK